MSDLRRPALISGDRLDVGATIRATIRNGAPTMRWRREARVREYVLLCERGSAADHMMLMADAIAARLSGANVAFTRYDFGLGHAVVRHAGGRRSGPPIGRDRRGVPPPCRGAADHPRQWRKACRAASMAPAERARFPTCSMPLRAR
ncbi:MAG: hypothetical protein WDN44_14155 [Sphingomonas sp.]